MEFALAAYINPIAGNRLCETCFLKSAAYKHLSNRERWAELKLLLEQQDQKCPYTGIKLVTGINASLDHIIPKSSGGINDISNFQWVYFGEDFDVNMMKRNFSSENFLNAVKIIYENKYHENISTMASGKEE